LSKLKDYFYLDKSSPKIRATFVIFQKNAKSKQSPNKQTFGQSGHPDNNSKEPALLDAQLFARLPTKLVGKERMFC
jgi:hypothetical protein